MAGVGIGFKVKSGGCLDDGKQFRTITEVDLKEVSVVPFPPNSKINKKRKVYAYCIKIRFFIKPSMWHFEINKIWGYVQLYFVQLWLEKDYE